MRAEEGGDDRDGVRGGRITDRLERPHLGLELEPVAALHLGGGGALEQHLVEAGADRRRQLRPRRLSRRLDAADDATPGGRDLTVAGPGQPAADLLVAVPREGEVRVGVDEAGNDGRAFGVEHRRPRLGGHDRGKAGLRARVHDAPAVDGHGDGLHEGEVAQAGARARSGSRQRREAADVADDEVGRRHRRASWRAASRCAPAPDRLVPATATSLSRPDAPLRMRTAEGGTSSIRPSSRPRAALASPSTGGAVSLTTSAPWRTPSTPSRGERGLTRTRSVSPPSASRRTSASWGVLAAHPPDPPLASRE